MNKNVVSRMSEAKTGIEMNGSIPPAGNVGTPAAIKDGSPEDLKLFYANESERLEPRTARNISRGYRRW